MDGKMAIYGYDRDGTRAQAGFPATYDVYALFFTKDAYDRYRLSKEDYALLKEMEDKQKDSTDTNKKETKKGKSDTTAKKDTTRKKDIQIDWDNLSDRKARLTISSANIADMTLSKDGSKLFYLAKFEKGYDLWVTELRTKDTKLFVKLGAKNAGMELSADGKNLFLLNDGRIVKIDPESAKLEPVPMNGEMILNQYEEKAYIFDHLSRQIKEKFLFADLNHVDWDYYYNHYKKFLPYINNNYDFAEMASEMLGELNASHTGCYYTRRGLDGDQTASLGIYYDYDYKGNGLKVLEVVDDGPLDKGASKIKAGCIIEKIDGDPITDSVDHYKYLNRKVNKLTLLSVFNPAANKRWEETVKPISMDAEFELLYKRWVNKRRTEVDSLSGGKIGYVQVRAMNDDSYRTVIEDVLGKNIDKQAIIVDTRFNGGGNIHEQLSDFLNGKKYFDIIPHGQTVGYEPYDKWIKPSIVLMGECNYSDAHLFPVAYKLKNVGKTIGMPVPGTGTFVWWEFQIDPSLIFGIPQGGWRMPDGKFCENTQLEPDIKVRNEPAVSTLGRDQQVETAVKELLK
jgi:tricorn protease